jgi:hypothetical protein
MCRASSLPFAIPSPLRYGELAGGTGHAAYGTITGMPETDTDTGWLSREQLRDARDRLPILYVNLVPVRVDERSQVSSVGLLLRATEQGQIQRELVSGRVLYHERLRDAVLRHIERDLGPMALPQVPLSPQPFAIAEYFPTPGVTPFHDPRQHAVALGYVVVLMGDCTPQGNALDLAWLSPAEALELAATPEMGGGHGVLLRQALAHLGHAV